MKTLSLLLFAFLIITSLHAKIFDRFELIEEFNKNKIKNAINLACIVSTISEYNSAYVHEMDGITTNGLFGINSTIWCHDERIGGACDIHCAKLRDDDIQDDIDCVKEILNVQGIAAWANIDKCAINNVEVMSNWILNEKRSDMISSEQHNNDNGDDSLTYGDLLQILSPIFF